MECQCTQAGFCERYKRFQSERNIAICKGEVLTPKKCGVYRANWEQLRKRDERTTPERVGTELTELLKSLGLKPKKSCDCATKAKEMDRLGVDGCRQKFDELRQWLVTARAEATWGETIRAAAAVVTTGLAIDPLDVEGSLIRIAIERADAARPAKDQA